MEFECQVLLPQWVCAALNRPSVFVPEQEEWAIRLIEPPSLCLFRSNATTFKVAPGEKD